MAITSASYYGSSPTIATNVILYKNSGRSRRADAGYYATASIGGYTYRVDTATGIDGGKVMAALPLTKTVYWQTNSVNTGGRLRINGGSILDKSTGVSPYNGTFSMGVNQTISVTGSWTGGSGNTINCRICGRTTKQQVFYTTTPISITNTPVITTVTFYSTLYEDLQIYFYAGGIVPPLCTV
jgi:hypothetical protein